jgi:UPF0755 protein
VVTGSDPPPNGSERAAAGLRAALVRAADKPEPKARTATPAVERSSIASNSAQPSGTPRTRGVAPSTIISEQTAPVGQQLRSVVAGTEKSLKGASERPTNGIDGARLAASTARQRAPSDPLPGRTAGASEFSPGRASMPYSRDVGRPAPAVGESLPERPVNGPSVARMDTKNPKRTAPRSPRRALEPDTIEMPISREAGRAVRGTGEPYPSLSERLVNGIGMAPMDTKNSKRITPRSPRTALEPDTIEVPTRRSKSARHPFVVIGNAIISVLVLVAIVGGFALVVGKQRFEAPGPLAEDRTVNIPRGSGIRDIADVLTHEGVIDQPWVFVGGVLALKAREDLKAGEYQFKAHASLRDVVATIIEGRVVPHQVAIPEGLTSEQIIARLLADDVLTGNIKEIPREGSLLPDTYNFTRGVTREQMIQRMEQAQQRVLKEIWDHHSPDLPIKTPDQLVILASLVEKETGKSDERTRVAAVFINRLKQKMKLQSDPTIIYGLVGGKGTLGRPIMKSEIDRPTPYNTYLIDGLPPGPIANPGRASLEAAANPARTRELYFVADGTGGHAFAETYEQHQKNVARLRQIETDQRDQAPPDAQLTSPPAQAATPAAAAPSQPSPPPRRNHHNQPTH